MTVETIDDVKRAIIDNLYERITDYCQQEDTTFFENHQFTGVSSLEEGEVERALAEGRVRFLANLKEHVKIGIERTELSLRPVADLSAGYTEYCYDALKVSTLFTGMLKTASEMKTGKTLNISYGSDLKFDNLIDMAIAVNAVCPQNKVDLFPLRDEVLEVIRNVTSREALLTKWEELGEDGPAFNRFVERTLRPYVTKVASETGFVSLAQQLDGRNFARELQNLIAPEV